MPDPCPHNFTPRHPFGNEPCPNCRIDQLEFDRLNPIPRNERHCYRNHQWFFDSSAGVWNCPICAFLEPFDERIKILEARVQTLECEVVGLTVEINQLTGLGPNGHPQ